MVQPRKSASGGTCSGNYMYHLHSPKFLHFQAQWINAFHEILKNMGGHSLTNLLIFVLQM
jgi:hypothetical protein